jgi:hypothetical protein
VLLVVDDQRPDHSMAVVRITVPSLGRTLGALFRKYCSKILAERVGFEPTVEFPLHTLSKRAPSTTRTSLRAWQSTVYSDSEIRKSPTVSQSEATRSTVDVVAFRRVYVDRARRTPYSSAVNVDVTTDVVIERPAQQVSAFASDPDNAPRWYVNIKQVEWLSPRPLVIGSRVAFVAHFLGRRMAYTYEVAEFVPGQRMVMRTADGPFPMETTYQCQPVDNGRTRMTLRNRGTPAGFSKWVAPFMAFAMRRANRKRPCAVKADSRKAMTRSVSLLAALRLLRDDRVVSERNRCLQDFRQQSQSLPSPPSPGGRP